jgi:predicted DNA-binding transcriptional regulator YafY
LRQQAEQARQLIHIDEAGWSRREETVPFLQLLLRAVWEERKLRFTYQKISDMDTLLPLPERTVDPLGLIAKGNAWYLTASTEEGLIRTYRVSRIRSAVVIDETFKRPEGFDLAQYWEQSKAELKQQLPRYPAELLIDPKLEKSIRQALYVQVKDAGLPEADQHGWIPLKVEFHNLQSACEYILGQGPFIQVLEPRELREHVMACIRRMASLYTMNTSSPGLDCDPQVPSE